LIDWINAFDELIKLRAEGSVFFFHNQQKTFTFALQFENQNLKYCLRKIRIGMARLLNGFAKTGYIHFVALN